MLYIPGSTCSSVLEVLGEGLKTKLGSKTSVFNLTLRTVSLSSGKREKMSTSTISTSERA